MTSTSPVGAPKAQVQDFATLSFIECAESVVLLRPSGASKSHLAMALGYRVVMSGIKTRSSRPQT